VTQQEALRCNGLAGLCGWCRGCAANQEKKREEEKKKFEEQKKRSDANVDAAGVKQFGAGKMEARSA